MYEMQKQFLFNTRLGIEDTEIKKLIQQRDKASKFIQAFSTCIIMKTKTLITWNYMQTKGLLTLAKLEIISRPSTLA